MHTYKAIKIRIKRNHKLYPWCHTILTQTRKTIDYATYIRRQNLFQKETDQYKTEKQLSKQFRDTIDKQALGHTQITTTIWNKTKKDWNSYWTLRKKGIKTKIPTYLKRKNKKYGYAEYHLGQNNSPAKIKNNAIHFLGTHKNKLKLNKQIPGTPKTIFIHHKNGSFWININYKTEEEPKYNNPNNTAAIDIGINNLFTITFNTGHKPIIISGKEIKSINTYYNKRKAKLQSELPTGQYTSKRIERLTEKRNLKIDDIRHSITKQLAQILNKHKIGTLIIGWNKGFKNKTNIGKVNNQKFTSIPHRIIIESLKDKCKPFLNIIETEESYTSKASFVDQDELPVFDEKTISTHKFSGKRIKRGLYKSKNGLLINADINGSYNIMRKVLPNVINSNEHGIKGFIVDPIRAKHPYKLGPLLHQLALTA